MAVNVTGLALRHGGGVDVDLRLVDRDDLGLVERTIVGIADEVVDRLGQDAAATDEAVDHLARRLARPEAGHLGALGDVPVRGREMPVDLVGGDLDLEDHLRPRLGSRRYGDQVSSQCVDAAAWWARRDSNSHVLRHRLLRPARLPFRHSPGLDVLAVRR